MFKQGLHTRRARLDGYSPPRILEADMCLHHRCSTNSRLPLVSQYLLPDTGPPHWGGGSMRKILILVWNTGEFKTSLVNGKVMKAIPSPACIGIILFKLGRRGFYFWYHK